MASFATSVLLQLKTKTQSLPPILFIYSFIFTFDKSKLSDVVAVVGGVDDVGVFQLARLNEHVVDLGRTKKKKKQNKQNPSMSAQIPPTLQNCRRSSKSPFPRCRPQTAASAVASSAACW